MPQVSDEQVISAILEVGGYVTFAAEKLGMSPHSVFMRAQRNKAVAEALAAARLENKEKRVQKAEKAIDTLLEGCGQYGDPHFGAAELTLSRLGKDRGWGPEKQGVNSSVTVSFEVNHIIPIDELDDVLIGEPLSYEDTVQVIEGKDVDGGGGEGVASLCDGAKIDIPPKAENKND